MFHAANHMPFVEGWQVSDEFKTLLTRSLPDIGYGTHLLERKKIIADRALRKAEDELRHLYNCCK
jgi:hypothetical protein